MASSKEKAVGLKDSYVSGLLDSVGAEAAAEAGAVAMQELSGKLGMEQGNTAGAVFDLENGVYLGKNDGNPRMVIRDGNMRMVQAAPQYAGNPVKGGRYGAEEIQRIHPSDMSALAAQLHGGGNNVDTTIYHSKNHDMGKSYKEQMYQPYTR